MYANLFDITYFNEICKMQKINRFFQCVSNLNNIQNTVRNHKEFVIIYKEIITNMHATSTPK